MSDKKTWFIYFETKDKAYPFISFKSTELTPVNLKDQKIGKIKDDGHMEPNRILINHIINGYASTDRENVIFSTVKYSDLPKGEIKGDVYSRNVYED